MGVWKFLGWVYGRCEASARIFEVFTNRVTLRMLRPENDACRLERAFKERNSMQLVGVGRGGIGIQS